MIVFRPLCNVMKHIVNGRAEYHNCVRSNLTCVRKLFSSQTRGKFPPFVLHMCAPNGLIVLDSYFILNWWIKCHICCSHLCTIQRIFYSSLIQHCFPKISTDFLWVSKLGLQPEALKGCLVVYGHWKKSTIERA